MSLLNAACEGFKSGIWPWKDRKMMWAVIRSWITGDYFDPIRALELCRQHLCLGDEHRGAYYICWALERLEAGDPTVGRDAIDVARAIIREEIWPYSTLLTHMRETGVITTSIGRKLQPWNPAYIEVRDMWLSHLISRLKYERGMRRETMDRNAIWLIG